MKVLVVGGAKVVIMKVVVGGAKLVVVIATIINKVFFKIFFLYLFF
jgi:hypothetical protein